MKIIIIDYAGSKKCFPFSVMELNNMYSELCISIGFILTENNLRMCIASEPRQKDNYKACSTHALM